MFLGVIQPKCGINSQMKVTFLAELDPSAHQQVAPEISHVVFDTFGAGFFFYLN